MSGVKKLIQLATKGRAIPTNADYKRVGVAKPASRPANLPKKKR